MLGFVARPTEQISVAQGLFSVGPGARPEPTRARHSLKIPTATSAFLYLWRLWRQAINPPEMGKSLGDGPLRPEEIPPSTSQIRTLFRDELRFISIYIQMVGTRPQVLGGGEGSGHAFLYVLRDLASHIRRPIQQ